ncbi:Uncharacterised protein [Mycobacteroides abscessus subsp. abscessus]|nr:Uncharacterised protein [Mycobacteroides abscessus subsp. abscessus]
MEMPILDMIFCSPLPRAVMRLRTACCGLTSVSSPVRTRCSTDSMARYGLTAEAP